jgi:hypothetical protein
MPNTPVNHIHKTAPGPPSDTAVATPTIFPVPTVAARAVIWAPKWLISPLPLSLSGERQADGLEEVPLE